MKREERERKKYKVHPGIQRAGYSAFDHGTAKREERKNKHKRKQQWKRERGERIDDVPFSLLHDS